MHPVFFGIKRAHLLAVAMTRPLLVDAWITPARFDMLRLVSRHQSGILQRNVRYLLGVSAATVSRMLKALEMMGLVLRKRWERDLRHVMVSLSWVGVDVMRRALHTTVDSGVAEQLATEGVIGPCADQLSPEATRAELTVFEDRLLHMRHAYDDTSPVRHPWLSQSNTLSFTEKVLSEGPLDCPLIEGPLSAWPNMPDWNASKPPYPRKGIRSAYPPRWRDIFAVHVCP